MNLDALDTTHNAALVSIIAERIDANGPISFAEFYELSMYHPQLGYYVTHDPTRDFQTSPNVHPVFGACIARQLASFWHSMGQPPRFDVFEAGASTGKLASDILRYLAAAEPEFLDAIRYVVQDVSLLDDRPLRMLESLGVSSERLAMAHAFPHKDEIEGCILSNELLDALPFHRVRVREGKLREVRVGFEHGRLLDVEAPADAALRQHFDDLGIMPGEGCEAEVCLAAPKWMQQAAGALRRGYMLAMDYGYEASELYASWRKQGTLLTFYRHTSDDDPYARIGNQDITASIDFTTIRRAGEAAGLETVSSVAQAEFLASLGIGEALSQPPDGERLEGYLGLRRAVMELTDPAGLGRITALTMAKDLSG